MAKNVYRADRRRAIVLYVCGGAAILVCVALIAFFIHALHLRTEYRAFCLEVNDAILASYGQDDRTISEGDKSCPLDNIGLNYYDQIFLDAKTVAYSRRSFEANDRSLILSFSGSRLILRELQDGYWIGIRWETPEGTRCYRIASANYSFMQMEAYFKNALRRAESAA